MAPFRKRDEFELDALTDEEVIEYIIDARAAGEGDAAIVALRILVYGYEPKLRSFVRGKVPSHEVDEVLMKVLDSGFTSVFEGEAIESFRAWIYMIARRRIADHLRRKRLTETPLPDEHEADDEIFGDLQAHEDQTGFVEVAEIVELCLAELSEPHRRVIDLAVFAGYTAAEVCEIVNDDFPDLDTPMSESNVDKIKSRFRKCLRKLLGDD
ncbi:MAG: RNA polymerase sigma factor [Solirubrobacterales bacterium]